MHCLKCGKERQEGQVFCDGCLKDMMEEPIDINAPVLLPQQPVKPPQNHRRPVINPEEELKRLQKFNQNLIMALVLLLTLVILLGVLVYEKEFWNVVDNLGQNYSVIETFENTIGR